MDVKLQFFKFTTDSNTFHVRQFQRKHSVPFCIWGFEKVLIYLHKLLTLCKPVSSNTANNKACKRLLAGFYRKFNSHQSRLRVMAV